MVAIFQVANGLKFTGKIAKDEKTAWEYLDKTYGLIVGDKQYPCNHYAFKIIETEEIENKKGK